MSRHNVDGVDRPEIAHRLAGPYAPSTSTMTALTDGLAAAIEEDHAALHEFMRGNPEPKKPIYSREDDATLAKSLGSPARGWADLSRRLDEASAILRDAASLSFEQVSAVINRDLAYTLEIEHYHGQQFAGSDQGHNVDLRVTTIFRRESMGWRIVHRHADTLCPVISDLSSFLCRSAVQVVAYVDRCEKLRRRAALRN
jgi:ketosteroid isomerase-like protein